MRDIIINGINSSKAQTFRYNQSSNPNTMFEVELYLREKLYSYGFTCNINDKTIIDEWLAETRISDDVYLLKKEEGKRSIISNDFFKIEN